MEISIRGKDGGKCCGLVKSEPIPPKQILKDGKTFFLSLTLSLITYNLFLLQVKIFVHVDQMTKNLLAHDRFYSLQWVAW